jgi:hypothetical protein
VITGALILLLGTALGWLLRSLPARRKDPKPIEAVCGCKHHHALHSPETGACNGSVTVSKYNTRGDWAGQEYHPCGCLRYSGPEPIPSLYAPEIAGEAGE